MAADQTPTPPVRPVEGLSFGEASDELDGIVERFEHGEVDVDQLVSELERATAIVDELDRRIRVTRAQVEELVPHLSAVAGNPRAESTGAGSGEPDDTSSAPPGPATDP